MSPSVLEIIAPQQIKSLLIQAKREIEIERPDKGPGTALDYC